MEKSVPVLITSWLSLKYVSLGAHTEEGAHPTLPTVPEAPPVSQGCDQLYKLISFQKYWKTHFCQLPKPVQPAPWGLSVLRLLRLAAGGRLSPREEEDLVPSAGHCCCHMSQPPTWASHWLGPREQEMALTIQQAGADLADLL